MKPVYIMIGGFLGAGKTTTIARLARHFVAQGKRIGIVTNDQTDDLVDTQTLRSQGFDVGEVAGSCFCCFWVISRMSGMTEQETPRTHTPMITLMGFAGILVTLLAASVFPGN